MKKMFMGKEFAEKTFSDVLGNCPENVVIDKRGWGKFPCEARRTSVWVRTEAFEDLTINE